MKLTKRMSKCVEKFSNRSLRFALMIPNESKQLESNSMKNQKTKSFSLNKKLNAHQSIYGIIYGAYICYAPMCIYVPVWRICVFISRKEINLHTQLRPTVCLAKVTFVSTLFFRFQTFFSRRFALFFWVSDTIKDCRIEIWAFALWNSAMRNRQKFQGQINNMAFYIDVNGKMKWLFFALPPLIHIM